MIIVRGINVEGDKFSISTSNSISTSKI